MTPTDIADEIWRTRKVRVDRRKIGLDEPIKRIGRYEVPIDLFTDVSVGVKTLVVPEGGELPPEEEVEAAASVEGEDVSETAAESASALADEQLEPGETGAEPAESGAEPAETSQTSA